MLSQWTSVWGLSGPWIYQSQLSNQAIVSRPEIRCIRQSQAQKTADASNIHYFHEQAGRIVSVHIDNTKDIGHQAGMLRQTSRITDPGREISKSQGNSSDAELLILG